jgi:hypothetical protein
VRKEVVVVGGWVGGYGYVNCGWSGTYRNRLTLWLFQRFVSVIFDQQEGEWGYIYCGRVEGRSRKGSR